VKTEEDIETTTPDAVDRAAASFPGLNEVEPATALVDPTSEPGLRQDAQRNRRRVVEAAGRVFAERGLSATMDDVAAEAGVGVGTVYRRFPQKELLIEAVFEHKVEDLVATVTRLAALEDPWEGLVQFLMDVQQRMAENRGFTELVALTPDGTRRMGDVHQTLAPMIETMVQRAKAAGRLRDDVTGVDIGVLSLMLCTVADYTQAICEGTWQRYAQFFLLGLCAPGPAIEPGPLSLEQFDEAMHSWKSAKSGPIVRDR
jgi:AcrR family transcriptional regulator